MNNSVIQQGSFCGKTRRFGSRRASNSPTGSTTCLWLSDATASLSARSARSTATRYFWKARCRVLGEFAGAVMDRLAPAKLAATDGLTGLLFRRSFREGANHLLTQASRHSMKSIACCSTSMILRRSTIIRAVAAGDEVLKSVALDCKDHLQVGDIFGRIGGERFAYPVAACGSAKRGNCSEIAPSGGGYATLACRR
jgi:GGDEF domain-containing protein